MKNKKTYYHLILDKSGSMSSCIEQTVKGVNSQIERIKELADRFPEQKLLTSFTLFNHLILPTWSMRRPEDVQPISFSDFRPEGSTALLDAIGITLQGLIKKVGREVECDEASVVVVIITDGYENASRSFTLPQVSSMIKELESTGRWTFSYLGATLDAVDIAVSLNIKESNAMSYSANASEQIYHKVNKSLDNYLFDKQAGVIKKTFLDDKDDESLTNRKN